MCMLYRAVRKTALEWGWLLERHRLWWQFANFFSITESFLIHLVTWVSLWQYCIAWLTLFMQEWRTASCRQAPCLLRGVMCPWFDFWFLHYIYIVCLFISHASPFILFTAQCYASTVLAMGLCLCLSVTSRSSTKTAKHRITQTTPRDSPGTLVFWCQRSPRNSTGVTPYEGAECRWCV